MRHWAALVVAFLLITATALLGRTALVDASQPVCGGTYHQLPIRWQSFQLDIWQVSNRCYHRQSALVIDPTLSHVAQAQADIMAAYGTIWHQNLYPLLDRGWRWAGEAVASGPDLWSAHAAICYSPPHLALQLYPDAEAIGAGVAMRPDGTTYVSVVFGDAR